MPPYKIFILNYLEYFKFKNRFKNLLKVLLVVYVIIVYILLIIYKVAEGGLGGKLDAVNICDPILSIITSIGLDHCGTLGNSLEEIAENKAGIIK